MEPERTIERMQQVAAELREDIAYQIARVTHGVLVSIVRPPDWDYATTEKLNQMVYLMRETGVATPGGAIGVVPDGSDVYVAVTGLSLEACTIAAEHIASKAARVFAGESFT